jgi:hypothetical protein
MGSSITLVGGLLGAGATRAALAAKRRRKSDTGPATAAHTAPEPQPAATSFPSSESPA